MAASEDIRDFLVSRRARLSPVEAGLPDFGGRRRVPGLRREEVALLAGMSTEYYVRLERGQAGGFSDSVLEGVSRALRLDEDERAHLRDLVRALNAGAAPRRRPAAARTPTVRASLRQMIDAMSTVPVFVQNGRLDAIATNSFGAALFSEMLTDPRRPANAARFVFLDERARSFYRDWESNTRQMVAILRREAGRSPDDRELAALVGELSAQSEHFARLWSSHDVREHRSGTKRIRHPLVGDLDLTFETLDLAADPGLQVLVFTAEPGSESAERLQLLAQWTMSPTP